MNKLLKIYEEGLVLVVRDYNELRIIEDRIFPKPENKNNNGSSKGGF